MPAVDYRIIWRTPIVWVVSVLFLPAVPWANEETSVPVAATKTGSPKTDASEKRSSAARQQLIDAAILAFEATHDGWSTDEVLLKDDLNEKFLAKCKEHFADGTATEFNWTLLNLRKAGKLGSVATKRVRQDHDDYQHAAEIAARFLQDKYEQTIDRLLCDPERRSEFDKAALSVVPDIEPYRLRKAAFGLRKARQLQPELVVRVADWKKEIITLPAAEIIAKSKLVPDAPGIYIFRDPTGYLYIGESSSLKQRVNQHLDQSDRKSLAHYLFENGNREITVELHVFGKDTPAKDKTRRRAYESELIRSRKPRFNIAP